MGRFRSHSRAPEAQKRLAAERREARCRAEHDAMDGDYWEGKIKSAERMLYDQPVDGAALKQRLTQPQADHFDKRYKKLRTPL